MNRGDSSKGTIDVVCFMKSSIMHSTLHAVAARIRTMGRITTMVPEESNFVLQISKNSLNISACDRTKDIRWIGSITIGITRLETCDGQHGQRIYGIVESVKGSVDTSCHQNM